MVYEVLNYTRDKRGENIKEMTFSILMIILTVKILFSNQITAIECVTPVVKS